MYIIFQSPGLEDSRNETIHVILRMQKNFRGVQACSRFKQLKAAAADLQSCNVVSLDNFLSDIQFEEEFLSHLILSHAIDARDSCIYVLTKFFFCPFQISV